MSDKQSKKMENLAELLPEGLTEHAVDEIAKLVDSVITERVDSEVNGLITKVNGFLRMKVDEIKEYALKEHEQDEEFVRNGHVFESMKTMMSVELDQHDKESAISSLVDVNEESQENISSLTKEVEKLMKDNEKLVSIAETFKDKISILENTNTELVVEAERLTESQSLPFESSEKAVMVSNSEVGDSSVINEEVLLENQAKAIVSERVDEVVGTDAPTTVGKLGTFQKFAFPLVRRVYPQLLANNLVGVQPMQGPVSQIFYLGHDRNRLGGQTEANRETIFSRFNLTYGNLTSSALDTGIEGNTLTGRVGFDTFSAANVALSTQHAY